MEGRDLLPVHGFVLAGGQSKRMGADKATMLFRGRPMVEIAVEKLRSFCADVSIAGNRDDLNGVAEVVHEERQDSGPAAGIEAGLRAARQPWAIFMPVDVPLVPSHLLRAMAERATPCYLISAGEPQPAFCLLPKASADTWSNALHDSGKLLHLLYAVGAEPLEVDEKLAFANLNTPEDFAKAETDRIAG
jgi:molybdopterin-guanine dinucleotide biosynthesis protein A